MFSLRGKIYKNVSHTNLVTKVCWERKDFSPERKKKHHYSSKDYREDECCELWLSFDKSYWADGSCEAEHSKSWNREQSQECSKRAGPHWDLLTPLRNILILLHFRRSEGGGSKMRADCSKTSWNTNNPGGFHASYHNSVNSQMYLSECRLSKIQQKT